MCYRIPSGRCTLGQVDGAVYTFALAVWYRSLIVCVSFSPHCAPHTRSLFPSNCLRSGKILMATSWMRTVLCSWHAPQPDITIFTVDWCSGPSTEFTSWLAVGRTLEHSVPHLWGEGWGALATPIVGVGMLDALTTLDNTRMWKGFENYEVLYQCMSLLFF